MNATATSVVCWSLALVTGVSLVAFQAPGLLCLAAAVTLAGIWCWQLESQVTRRPVRDDRDLHVAGEAHDPLDQTTTKQA
jgi:hypothetical protein